ncbi:ATP-binding protein [Candidatus Woesearchaeota archaeon]|nr:ATP-binding protein [Candidatus Woesearchaeota archaeon]
MANEWEHTDGSSAGHLGVVGQVISGGFSGVVVRQKSGARLEIGELLISDTSEGRILLQVFDLSYGSQLSQQSLELISGVKLEGDAELEFLDKGLRSYTLAFLKPLLAITGKEARVCKSLPAFFSQVRAVSPDDLSFLSKPAAPLLLGKVRSGSSVLDFDIRIDGEKALSHHIMIAAQTGKGKSNLTSCMLWDLASRGYAGILVLDPHDEYYGRSRTGLKDYPERDSVIYYTPNSPPQGARTLKINLRHVRPSHFNGVVSWSDAQREALGYYSKRHGSRWIEAVLKDEPAPNFHEGTLAVLKRRLCSLLDIEARDNEIYCNGIFDVEAGISTISDVLDSLEGGKVVIIDTSSFSGQVELLIGSLFASEALRRYRHYKRDGLLDSKPVISMVVEEAPRVLGREVVERGGNIFLTIAREGRKFKVGLIAITQLPSLIPKEVLANINTKIILGMEMAPERSALIESAAQDLTTDDRNIASLDKGEAIVTSAFTRFAIPIKIPLLNDLASLSISAAKERARHSMMAFPELKS